MFLADTIALDPANPLSTRMLIDRVRKGRRIVIFPEGRLTVTGSLMKIYEGPALIADKTAAQVLPIIISGAQYTPFSRLRGKVRIRWFPKITMTVMPPLKFDLPPDIRGRKRRHAAGIKLYDVMSYMMFQSNHLDQTLFQSLLDACSIHGSRHIIAEDVERKPINYRQLIMRCFILGAVLRKHTNNNMVAGVLLPNMVSTLICFCIAGLRAHSRDAELFQQCKNLIAACKAAAIETVITSRRFIQAGKLAHLVEALESQGIRIVYLEDWVSQISVPAKIKGALFSLIPQFYYRFINKTANTGASADTTAVILFTSGSEDVPKGVLLSHKNIQANRYQVSSRIDFGPTDIVFNVLPVFHSFD